MLEGKLSCDAVAMEDSCRDILDLGWPFSVVSVEAKSEYLI